MNDFHAVIAIHQALLLENINPIMAVKTGCIELSGQQVFNLFSCSVVFA